MSRAIEVAVALIRRGDGTLLLCQRPPHKSYPLKWEFPGGKLEPGESWAEALVRELREELSIEATVGALFHEETTEYAEDARTYTVRYYLIEDWLGEPKNNIFADLRWVAPGQLLDYDILEGNYPACRLLAGVSAGSRDF